MSKKDFSKATNDVAAKFFTTPLKKEDTESSNNTEYTNSDNIIDDTKHTHITQHTKPTNKSKHYDIRGKRSERYGILLDKQLKEDLQLLCNATNNRSLNDFIVTILLNHVETPENQQKLIAYKKFIEL